MKVEQIRELAVQVEQLSSRLTECSLLAGIQKIVPPADLTPSNVRITSKKEGELPTFEYVKEYILNSFIDFDDIRRKAKAEINNISVQMGVIIDQVKNCKIDKEI